MNIYVATAAPAAPSQQDLAFERGGSAGTGSKQGARLSLFVFFFSSRRRHTRFDCDWSSDVCSSDLRASGPVRTPDGRPFEDYIRRALVDELKVAEMLSDSAPVTLTGNLDKIDFNSMAGDWTMHLTATSSNGRSLSVSSKYGFSTGPVF